jgi:hypothetical protein
MYLMYVDESGDCGLVNSPTRYFVLSGLIVHESLWRASLDRLTQFRRYLKQRYGLRLCEEFHASQFICRPGRLVRIKRYDRLAMIRAFAHELAAMPDFAVINVVASKQEKQPDYDVFGQTWRALVMGLELAMRNHALPGPVGPEDQGIVFCDHTDDRKLILLLRGMHQYYPLPGSEGDETVADRARPQFVIEDASHRDSEYSYFIQAADLAAFLLYQRLAPSAYARKHYAHDYFRHLKPILCRAVCPEDPDGIVRL